MTDDVLKQKIFDYLDENRTITITECCDIFDAEAEDVIDASIELLEEGRIGEIDLFTNPEEEGVSEDG